MPIKQSSLEKKRYYRLGKSILFLLPIFIIARMFIQGKWVFPEITSTNIAEVMKNNYKYIIYGILGYGGYVLIIYIIRLLILYIGFGGIENDKTNFSTRIKKSRLERKMFYRIAKVIYRTLPIAVLIILTTKGYIDISSLTVNTIAKSNYLIVAGIVVILLYYFIIAGFRKLIFYIGFGGILNDTIKMPAPVKQVKGSRAVKYIVQPTPVQEEKKENRGRFRILVILIIYIASYSVTPKFSTIFNTPTKKSQCIPTNCGNDRRSYCTNRCYTTQSSCMEAGRGICSNNMCRQCP